MVPPLVILFSCNLMHSILYLIANPDNAAKCLLHFISQCWFFANRQNVISMSSISATMRSTMMGVLLFLAPLKVQLTALPLSISSSGCNFSFRLHRFPMSSEEVSEIRAVIKAFSWRSRSSSAFHQVFNFGSLLCLRILATRSISTFISFLISPWVG